MNKEIKIFNTPWHLAHQAALTEIPNTKWFHIVNTVRKPWKKDSPRPVPKNIFRVPHYEPGKYDLAVLHVDQQCVDETLGKSRLYKELNEAIKDIPKIVINHGTPYWPEAYNSDYIIMKMKMMIGDNHIIYNSHRAKEMWEKNGPIGKTSRTIIHGMDPDEWIDNPKEPIVFTTLSPAGLDKYYNRSLLLAVKDKLKQRGIAHIWVGHEWTSKDFDDYRNFISRPLIYFNPTKESPMPRSRTEAMLSGACIITLANHGAEKFIKQGVNGYLVPNNPNIIVDLIDELINNQYKKTVAIGQKGKETAKELFHIDRFVSDWSKLLTEVL